MATDPRDALLAAALACFVRDGVRASTLRAIAREAGVTPALLHYYFGDKDQLLDAVVETRLLPVLAELRQGIPADECDPRTLALSVSQGILATAERHPWLPAFWVREVLSEGGALRDRLVERIAPLLAQPLSARFATAQQRGELPRGVDPRLLVISIIGLTLFPLAAAPIWRNVFPQPELGNEALSQHITALLGAALESRHAY